MKLRVGHRHFGEISDEVVKSRSKSIDQRDLIHELLVDAAVRMVRRYIRSDKDKRRVLEAMGYEHRLHEETDKRSKNPGGASGGRPLPDARVNAPNRRPGR